MSPENCRDRCHIDPDVDPRGRLVVEQLLAEGVCVGVDYRQTSASTNSLALAELMQTDSSGPLCPKLFLADHQTAGRGRHGRRWVSGEASLAFSLIVPRAKSPEQISPIAPLSVGVGIAHFLEFEYAPIQVKLKWPNDVHVGGGKVAGILMETSSTRPDRMVVGVGMNVGNPPELESRPETQTARGLAQVLGRSLERYDVLFGIVSHILKSLEQAETDPDQAIDSFRSHCLLSGQLIGFQDGGRHTQGRCQGISRHGALVVETEQGVRHLQSGEVNLIRPKK